MRVCHLRGNVVQAPRSSGSCPCAFLAPISNSYGKDLWATWQHDASKAHTIEHTHILSTFIARGMEQAPATSLIQNELISSSVH